MLFHYYLNYIFFPENQNCAVYPYAKTRVKLSD